MEQNVPHAHALITSLECRMLMLSLVGNKRFHFFYARSLVVWNKMFHSMHRRLLLAWRVGNKMFHIFYGRAH